MSPLFPNFCYPCLLFPSYFDDIISPSSCWTNNITLTSFWSPFDVVSCTSVIISSIRLAYVHFNLTTYVCRQINQRLSATYPLVCTYARVSTRMLFLSLKLMLSIVLILGDSQFLYNVFCAIKCPGFELLLAADIGGTLWFLGIRD